MKLSLNNNLAALEAHLQKGLQPLYVLVGAALSRTSRAAGFRRRRSRVHRSGDAQARYRSAHFGRRRRR